METKQQRYRKTEKYTISRLKSQQKRKERYHSDPEYREHVKKQKRFDYRRHVKDYIQRARDWSKANPERRYQSTMKNHKKGSVKFNISVRQYKYALHSWSKVIRERDNNQCQICGNPAEETHHIFYKSYYPLLSLNINNGISLCLEHHYEIHGKVMVS